MADARSFPSTSSSPTEPSADLRQMASACRQMYVALCNEGFSQNEALSLLGTVIAAAVNSGQGGGPK